MLYWDEKTSEMHVTIKVNKHFNNTTTDNQIQYLFTPNMISANNDTANN